MYNGNIVDKVVTDELIIGSTFKNSINTTVGSNVTLTLPSTIGANKNCLTANGTGSSNWSYAQNRADFPTLLSSVITVESAIPARNFLTIYSTTPSMAVSKLNANGNASFKNRYIKSNIYNINLSQVIEFINFRGMVFNTIGSGTSSGSHLSTTLLNNGCPMISYVNASTSFVTIAICSTPNGNGSWYIETIDATSIAVGTSICILANGCPAVTYLDITTTNLMFAVNSRPDGLGYWTISSVEATGAITSTGNNVSMCVTATGLPIIAYYYSSTMDLRIAVNANVDGSGAWTITTVDSASDTGGLPKITLLSNGCPVIVYLYNTTPSCRIAVSNNVDGSGVWTISTIGTVPNTLSAVSICILSNGLPMASYFAPGALISVKYAYNTTSDGLGTWNTGTIYASGTNSVTMSIGVTSIGIPYVLYCKDPAIYVSYNSLSSGLGTWTFAAVEVGNCTSTSVLSLSNGYPAMFYYVPASGGIINVVTNPFKDSFVSSGSGSSYQLNGLVKS